MKRKCFFAKSIAFLSFYATSQVFAAVNPEVEVATFIRTTQANMQPKGELDFEPLPKVAPYEPYDYQSGTINPFAIKDFVLDNSIMISGLSADMNCDAPPVEHEPYFLESFELEQLQMVGTILDKNNMRVALIQTPEAIVINAGKGEYLGKNHGMINTIEEGVMNVTERYEVAPNCWQKRDNSLKLLLN